MKIVDYGILHTDLMPVDLEKKVKAMLAEGWQPLGGVCRSGTRLVQAMVKIEE